MSAVADALRHTVETVAPRVAQLARPAIEARAKAECPVDTGLLQSSITASAEGPRVVLRTPVYYGRFHNIFAKDYSAEIAAAVRAL